MKAVFLGGTRGMGRAIARILAERGDEVFILGNEPDDIARSAADLSIASGKTVGHALCDILDRHSFAPALDQAWQALDGFDTVVVTAGLFGSQETLEQDADFRDRLLTANYTNTVHFCEEARRRLLDAGGGTLCVFSSVAGERGRKPVILYGSAKAGLSCYLEGLDHKYRMHGLRTITVKPGFVKTGMTVGLKPPPFAAEPGQVARLVVRAIDRGTPEVYATGIWRWIMRVIKTLPRFVMRRIGF